MSWFCHEVFAARRGHTWLSWDETVALAESLGLPMASWWRQLFWNSLSVVWRRCSWRCWLSVSFPFLTKTGLPKLGTKLDSSKKTRHPPFFLLPRCHWFSVVHFPPRSSSRNLWRNGRQKSLLLELTLRQKAPPEKTVPAERLKMMGFLKKECHVSRDSFFRFYVSFRAGVVDKGTAM